ncbi:MAG: hypothetical protein JST08_12010 [Actinobacteria bacterium]|nr:hypothetical protein [Actinomycetota bacterium]
MRIDLSDLDRLTGIADALERLFWCLMAVGFLTAILGSAGTGLFVLILGAAAFVLRTGLEDFVDARREEPAAPVKSVAAKKSAARKKPAAAKKLAGSKQPVAAEKSNVVKKSAAAKKLAGLKKPVAAKATNVAKKPAAAKKSTDPKAAAEPEFTVYRTPRRVRRTKSSA